jgi:hypothetical protein
MKDANGFKYFCTDHPGSAVLSATGIILEQPYLPFAEARSLHNYQTIKVTDSLIPANAPSHAGLMDYKARLCLPYLNHNKSDSRETLLHSAFQLSSANLRQ